MPPSPWRPGSPAVARQLNAVTEESGTRLAKIGDLLRHHVGEGSAMTEAVVARVETASEAVGRQLRSLGAAGESTEGELAALAEMLAQRGREVATVSDQALARIGQWDQTLEGRSRALGAVTDQVTGQARQMTKALDAQAKDLQQASWKAQALTETLKLRTDEVGSEDFLRHAAFVSERLQSLAVDMNRLMETSVSEEDWRRYSSGERSIFVRKILGFREKSKLAAISKKFQREEEFRGYVTRYLDQFEGLLSEAKKVDRGDVLGTTFLSSDMGKVYMLLCRAVGRER